MIHIPIIAQDQQSNTLDTQTIIKKTEINDFDAITKQGIITFLSLYKPDTQEKENTLKKRYTARIESEKNYFLKHPDMLSFTIFSGNTLVGFLAAEKTTVQKQLYLRHVFVIPSFQRKGLLKKLLKQLFDAEPTADHIVLLTNKENTVGQTKHQKGDKGRR